MPVGIYHDWPTRPETQANTPVRSDRARSSQAGGLRKLLGRFVLPSEHCVKTIPLLNQIQKVFVRSLAMNNGRRLKPLWVNCSEICQLFLQTKKNPDLVTQIGAFGLMPGSNLARRRCEAVTIFPRPTPSRQPCRVRPQPKDA